MLDWRTDVCIAARVRRRPRGHGPLPARQADAAPAPGSGRTYRIGFIADALLVLPDPVFFTARDEIAALASKARLPSMYSHREHTEAGGLMSYGANIAQRFRRAATFVDKILNGATPASLPIEQATTFESHLNMRTAKKGTCTPAWAVRGSLRAF